MPPKADATRKNFEAGKCRGWTTGDHGRKVRVFAERGRLKVTYRPSGRPRPVQDTLFLSDSPELRQKATAAAVVLAEKLRAGKARAEAGAKGAGAADLTVFKACSLYMARIPGWEDALFGKTASEIVAWWHRLPESVRTSNNVPGPASAWTDVYAFRRLWKDPRFAKDRLVLDIEPGDGTGHFNDRVAAGAKPRTPSNDLDRLSCAFRYVRDQHRKTIGLLFNPLEGRKVDRTRARIPMWPKDQVPKLWRAARARAARGRGWHVLPGALFASSGRRLGSMRALTAADHVTVLERQADGRWRWRGLVTWRAEAAKGEQYGRGDEVRPLTHMHLVALRYCRRFRPNPLGLDYPLLWQGVNPTREVPQGTMWKQLESARKAAGIPKVEG